MGQPKGCIPWNKGSKGLQVSWCKGKKLPPVSEELREKRRIAQTGRKHSTERCKRISESHKGDKNPAWKGGTSPINSRIRRSFEYRQWRSDVFKRDDYTCQECGEHTGHGKAVYLEAHHLKQFSLVMEENNIKSVEDAMACAEMWDINNGLTLCEPCHDLTKRGRNVKRTY